MPMQGWSRFPPTCGVEPLMAMAEMPGPYDVREYACVARAVLTHTCPMAPYRGVSRPVITVAIERLMDKAAGAFNLDPIEIRRRNLIQSFPYTSATGLLLDQASYVETMDAAVQAAGVAGFRARQAHARAQGRHPGLGLATFCERTGYGTPAFAARGMEVTPGWETVEMTMDPSGWIEARIGASPMVKGCAPRWRRSLRMSSEHLPIASRSCTAIPTAPHTAGALSPVAPWSSPVVP